MDTWPVTLRTDGDRAWLGIPDRLGEGRPYRLGDSFPTLEEIAGENWSAEVLAQLLPPDRAWAWWTRTEFYRLSGLPTMAAPAVVDLRKSADVVTHRLLLKRMTLAIIPPGRAREQDAVREYAGVDTEHEPDQIWTSPDGADTWDLQEIVGFCKNPAKWTDARSAAQQRAERIVVMFDNEICCASTAAAARLALQRIEALAATWRLRVIQGPDEYAWPVKR